VASAHRSFVGISGASCEGSVPTGHLVKETPKAGIDGGRCVRAQSLPSRRPWLQSLSNRRVIHVSTAAITRLAHIQRTVFWLQR
jgi:hypothetical protein